METGSQKDIRLWLEEALAQRGRGARKELSIFIKTNQNAITQMIKPAKGRGYRVITAPELIKMAEFFNKTPPGFDSIFPYPSQRKLLELVRGLSDEEADWLLPVVQAWCDQTEKARQTLSQKEEKK